MYLEFTYQMQMLCLQLRLSPVPYLFLCRRNTICTFSEPQWAFALLAAQEIMADEVGRTHVQATSSSKAVGLTWNSESSHSSKSNKYGQSQPLGSRSN